MSGNMFTIWGNISTKALVTGYGLILIPFLGVIVLNGVLSRRTPMSTANVVGCYEANGAPSLEISITQIRIIEPAHRTLNYSIEVRKNEYGIENKSNLELQPVGGGRLAFHEKLYQGSFWPLLAANEDDPPRVQKPNDYGGRFQIYASDDSTITYKRISRRPRCDGKPEMASPSS